MKRRLMMSWVVLAAGMLFVACNGKKKINGTTPPPNGNGGKEGDLGPMGKGTSKPKIKLTKKEKKSYEKAVKVYLEAAKEAEKNGAWTGDLCKKTADAFSAVAAGNPRLFAHGKHNEGISWLHCGKKKRAKAAFSAVMGKKPNFAPTLVSLGYLKSEQGNIEGAFKNFQKAFLSDMRNAEASYNMGVYYREKTKSGAKLTNAQRRSFMSLKAPQGHYAYRNWIQNKLTRRGKKLTYKELALRHLRTVLAITSGSKEPNAALLNLKAYTMIALVYTDAADKLRAQLALANLVIKEAEKLIDGYNKRVEKEKLPPLCKGKNPTPMDKAVAELKNVHGLVALKKKEKDLVNAMKRFTAAVSCDPDFWEAHMNIGAIALGFRGYRRAKASFEVVLKEKPKYPEAVMGLGVAYRGLSALAMADAKDKAISEAEAHYKKVMTIVKPQDKLYADALYNLGLLYQDYKVGNSDEDNKKRLESARSYYQKYAKHPKTERKAKKNALTRAKDITRTFKIMAQMADLKRKQEERERRLKEQEKNKPRPRPRGDGAKDGKGAPRSANPRPARAR